LNRQTFIERLRAWAMRADNEVVESIGTAKLAWQGQANVLHALANVVGSGSGGSDPAVLREQIISERRKALNAWNAERDPERAAGYTGETQAYELVLDLLKEVDSWTPTAQAGAR
jgi:hypothetical protein